MASESVKALTAELTERGHDVIKVYPDRNYKYRKGDLVINWGNGRVPTWEAAKVLNPPKQVEVAGNKLSAFTAMSRQGVSIPEMTDNRATAQQYVNDGSVIVVRHLLRGHSGAGIELVGINILAGDRTGIVPEAPLYTVYRKKSREYRIHVFNNNVLYWQQKMVRRDFPKEDVNYQVRNHANGWIYATEAATQPPPAVLEQAKFAVQSLGLNFGAVDVVLNEHHQLASVLEVNTAPGVVGTTVTKYANAIIGEL